MPEIGYASMPVIATFKGLQGDLERGSSKALTAAGSSGGRRFGDTAGKAAGSRFGSVFKNAAKAGIVGALGGIALGGKLLSDSIGAASDLNETISKTEQIFGKGATPGLVKFADAADQKLGQTKQQALDAAATFGIFGKSAGLQGGKLVKFSSRMDKLASDMASFSNTSPDQAIEAIGAAMRGESEPIRSYGVLLDEATLKAEALRLGILKPVKDKTKILSAQARVTASQKKYNAALKGGAGTTKAVVAQAKIVDAQAKYNAALKKSGAASPAAITANARLVDAQSKYQAILSKGGKGSIEAITAQGQLGAAQSALEKATAGTIPPLTQQQKVIAAQSSILKQTKDQQGDFARTSGGLANQQRILSARFENTKAALGKGLLPIATKVVTYLNDKGVPQLNKFSDWFTTKGIPAIKKFTEKAKPFVEGVLSDTRDVLKQIAPYAKSVVDSFNKLPPGVKKGLGAAAVIGAIGSKLPGAKPAVGAATAIPKLLLGQFTKAGVQKVYVVNKSFGGDGLPGKPKPTPGGPAPLPGILGFPLPGLAGVNAETRDPFHPRKAPKIPFTDITLPGGDEKGAKRIPDSQLNMKQLQTLYGDVLKNGTGEGIKADAARLRELQGLMDGLKNKSSTFANGFDTAKVKAQNLNNEVKLIGSNARSSRAQVRELLREIDRARNHMVSPALQQGVSGARTGKVDRQLGGGGINVGVMNVHGTSLPEVRRDISHQHRARANGAESFRD